MRAQALAIALSRTGDQTKRDTEQMKASGGNDYVIVFMTFTYTILYRLATEILKADREDNPEEDC